MSSFTAHQDENKRAKTISYGLVIIFFCTVLFILYSIFPRHLLHKQIMLASTNDSLSEKYLYNLTKAYPKNIAFQFEIIENLINNNEFDLAVKKIQEGKFYNDKSHRNKALHLEMLTLKTRYYSKDENNWHMQTINMMAPLFQRVRSFDITNEMELKYWYANTIGFSSYESAIYFAQKLDELSYLSDTKYSGGENVNIVNFLFFKGEKEKARLYVKNRIIYFQLWYKKLSKQYKNKKQTEQFYQHTKRGYFTIISELTTLKQTEQALKFAREYEADFYEDPKMSRKLVKIYLSLNSLKDAQRVAKHRLRHAVY